MSFQSTLGDGVAEELAANQRAISIAEFFEKNKQMLGFDSEARALVTAVKEAVDNALDAAEEARIRPNIEVEIEEAGDYYRLIVEDNGPGITREQIPNIFGKLLYGSRFHAREQSLTADQRLLVRRNGTVEFIPIGDLCDAYLPPDGAETRPIPDAVEVPSFNRETHEMSWEPVTHAIRHETDERTYEITTQKGRTVEVTGNHSVFSVTKDGETKEVKAATLEAGDAILTPRTLPGPAEPVESVNLLEHLTPDQLEDRRVYVYGFDQETLETLRDGENVRKRPSADSDRKRTYYRYDGVDVLKDSLETNYLEKGYLPADVVLALGWEGKAEAADCEFRTYQVGGEETTMPVSVPLDGDFAKLLGYYVSEGHVDERQVGFTFGSHESSLIEATEEAVASVGGGTTTVERERNSTRVKAFGSPLRLFLEATCGSGAREKHVPGFVFEAPSEFRRRFIAALHEGDGSDSRPSNELSHTTTSETLARQLSVLWNMEGVLASTESVESTGGYAAEPARRYRTKVYGDDAEVGRVFGTETEVGRQQYKRIPTSLLDDVRVDEAPSETVPDSIPGLLMAAGVGSDRSHAAVYQSLIEDALDGEHVEQPRYVHNLREQGLLDDRNQPTDRLRELWNTVQNLQGITETDMCLLPVERVVETEAPEYVYDVSVPGATGYDENFVVANEGALSVKNSRGQQGIGISATVLYAQLTSGKPARIVSRTKGADAAQEFELVIDTDDNEPEIRAERELAPAESPLRNNHGTRIELEMEGNMRARQQLHDYIRHTAVVNPHATIKFREPDAEFTAEAEYEADLPEETEEIRPHPHGVELGNVLKMLKATDSHSLSGFLQSEFTRVGKKTADDIVDAFRDRHVGREVPWSLPEEDELRAEIRAAVNNKSSDATKEFAERVIAALDARLVENRLAHADVVDAVETAAEGLDAATFGSTVRENVVEEFWAAMATVPDDPPKVREVADDRDVAARFVEAMRETDIIAPPTSCLSPISEDLVETGLRRQFDAEFYAAATRDAEVHAGDPFVVEAGIAYGGELDPEGEAEVLRFANRVPLVYKRGGCAITQVVQDIGWRNYELDQPGGTGVPQGPAVVMVHVASTNVPFTSESKDAVAGVPEIEDEIELAIREAARELKSYLKEQRSMEKRRRKQNVLADILPRMATKVAEVTDREEPSIDDALARIMNNVLVERETDVDGDEMTVTLAVENNGSTVESVELTDIVPAEPRDVSEGATVVEMDGEWFLSWEPEVDGGDRETISYAVDADADLDRVSVQGINDAKLTNDTRPDQ